MPINLPNKLDLLSFFSSEPKRDEYDELTILYEVIDKNSNRLELAFNEATRTICTTLFKENDVLDNVFVEGLLEMYFIDKNQRKCLVAKCKKGNYAFKLELFIEPLIQINWKVQEIS